MSQKTHSGFTIIEVMVVVVIVAILLMIAVPSFTSFIQNSRTSTQYNDIVGALNYARSEAITRSTFVTVEQQSAPADGNPANCPDTGGWDEGYRAFVDFDGDGALDAGDGDLLIVDRSSRRLLGCNTLTAMELPGGGATEFTNENRVTFDNRGFAVNSAGNFTGYLLLCDDRSDANNHAKAVIITTTGRPRYAADFDEDGIVDVENQNISCP